MLIAAVLASLSGSGSGVYLYMKNIGPGQLQTMARPDPATGTEMRRLDSKVDYHLQNHPDVTNRFDGRLIKLEVKLEILEDKMDQLLEQSNRIER